MFRLISTGLFAAALLTGAAYAQGVHDPIQTGSELHLACGISLQMSAGDEGTRASRTERQRCRNYLSGFVQASAMSRNGSGMTSPYSPTGEDLFCYQVPDEMSWEEMELLVVTYGDANPDALDMYAADFLVEIFVANSPCEEPDMPVED
jgi:hypothetical protein